VIDWPFARRDAPSSAQHPSRNQTQKLTVFTPLPPIPSDVTLVDILREIQFVFTDSVVHLGHSNNILVLTFYLCINEFVDRPLEMRDWWLSPTPISHRIDLETPPEPATMIFPKSNHPATGNSPQLLRWLHPSIGGRQRS